MMGMGAMAFFFSDHMENLLFHNLNIKGAGGTVAICIGITLLSILLESVKLLREYLFSQINTSCCQPSETSQLTLCGSQISKKIRILFHFTQAFMHMIQIYVAYILMLCVMSFNAWYIISAVFGLTLGYFLCGAILPKQFGDTDCQMPKVSTASYSSTTTVIE